MTLGELIDGMHVELDKGANAALVEMKEKWKDMSANGQTALLKRLGNHQDWWTLRLCGLGMARLLEAMTKDAVGDG
jgi:hypothetical protein